MLEPSPNTKDNNLDHMVNGRSPHFLEKGVEEIEVAGLAQILLAIARTGQMVSRQLSFRVGMTKSVNPFGERQAELDVFTNEAFSKALLDTGIVGTVASEELETPLTNPNLSVDSSFSVAMDPLDGSSNITTNNPLGSIFGIWRGRLPQSGRKLMASAFITYGPTLSLTFTTNGSVEQYVELREGENSGRLSSHTNQSDFLKSPKCTVSAEQDQTGFRRSRGSSAVSKRAGCTLGTAVPSSAITIKFCSEAAYFPIPRTNQSLRGN